jgi:hypothetical protein
MFHCWNQAFQIVGFLRCSPDITAWRATYLTTLRARLQLSDVQVLWSWHHRLRIRALRSVIRGLATAALPRILGLWTSFRTVFVETGASRWIFSSVAVHMCCSSALIFRNNPSQCTTISFCHCRFSTTVSLRSCCLPMICVCQHNLWNCCSRYT